MIFAFFSILGHSYTYLFFPGSPPHIFAKKLEKNDCVLIDILNSDYFITFSSVNMVSISKYISDVHFTKFTLMHETIESDFSRFDWIQSIPTRYVFNMLEDGFIYITTGSLDTFKCDQMLLISNPSFSSSFSHNSSFIFELPITQKRCYFIATPGIQIIDAFMGDCDICPTFDLYAGTKKVLSSVTRNLHISLVNQYYDTPTFIVISPNPKGPTDVQDIEFNTSTNISFPIHSIQCGFILRKDNSPDSPTDFPEHIADTYAFVASCFLIVLIFITSFYMSFKEEQKNLEAQKISDAHLISEANAEREVQYTIYVMKKKLQKENEYS